MFDVTISVNGRAAEIERIDDKRLSALREGRRYGEYFLLDTDTGRVTIKTVVADLNADPVGIPSATYTAAIDEGWYEIKKISLGGTATSPDLGITLKTPIKKLAGEKIVLSLTIRLYLSLDFAAFTSGDNPLVKWLLGAVSLPSDIKIAVGADMSALSSSPPATEVYGKKYPAQIAFTESGIKFTATVALPPVELLLIVDGKTAMRALPLARDLSPKAASEVASGGKICFDALNFGVSAVCANSVPVSDYRVERGRNRVGAKHLFGAGVGHNPRLITDGDCTLAAAVSGGEGRIMRLYEGNLVSVTERKIFDCPTLTSDGSFFSTDGETLVRTDPNGETRRYPFTKCDELCAVIPSFGRYVLAARSGREIKVFSLAGGELSLTETLSANGACGITAIDGKRILACGKNFGCKIFGGDLPLTRAFVERILSSYETDGLCLSGRLMSFTDRADGKTYLLDIRQRDGTDIALGGADALSGELCLYGTKCAVVDIKGGICSMELGEKPFCGVRIENTLVFADGDGNVWFRPLCGEGTSITSDFFSDGAGVTFIYYSPNVSRRNTCISIDFFTESE